MYDKRIVPILAILVLIALAGAGSLQAAVSTGPVPFEDRFAESNLVCECVVTKIVQTSNSSLINGKLPPADYLISATVKRLYKGKSQSSVIQIALRAQDPMWGRPVSQNSSYILFLGVIAPGIYKFIDTAGSITPFSAQDVKTPATSGAEGLETDIRKQLGIQLSSTANAKLIDLLLQFRNLSSNTIATLDPISRGAPSVAALLSLEALCRNASEPSEYSSKLITMLSNYKTWSPAELAELGDNLSGIGDILATESTKKDLSSLEWLTTSPVSALRLCAMLGIRRLKDPSTLTFLIGKLDDSDRQIQYEAIITLSELTGKTGEYGPGMGLFVRDPSRYINLWKSWYADQKLGSRGTKNP